MIYYIPVITLKVESTVYTQYIQGPLDPDFISQDGGGVPLMEVKHLPTTGWNLFCIINVLCFIIVFKTLWDSQHKIFLCNGA